MFEWQAFADRETLDEALAAHVVSSLQQRIAQRGTAHLVLSGGSTPVNLYSILADADVDWSRRDAVGGRTLGASRPRRQQ